MITPNDDVEVHANAEPPQTTHMVVLPLPAEITQFMKIRKEPIDTLTIEFARAYGHWDPHELEDCQLELDNVALPEVESVQLSEAVGRNLCRLGIMLIQTGRRVAIADHTCDPAEVHRVVRELLHLARFVPTELAFNAERALDSAPYGDMQASPHYEPVQSLIREWPRSPEYLKRMGQPSNKAEGGGSET